MLTGNFVPSGHSPAWGSNQSVLRDSSGSVLDRTIEGYISCPVDAGNGEVVFISFDVPVKRGVKDYTTGTINEDGSITPNIIYDEESDVR